MPSNDTKKSLENLYIYFSKIRSNIYIAIVLFSFILILCILYISPIKYVGNELSKVIKNISITSSHLTTSNNIEQPINGNIKLNGITVPYTDHLSLIKGNLHLAIQTKNMKMNNFSPSDSYYLDGRISSGKYKGYYKIVDVGEQFGDPNGYVINTLATADGNTFILDSGLSGEYASPNEFNNSSSNSNPYYSNPFDSYDTSKVTYRSIIS